MEKKTALAMGALAVIAGLALLTGVVYAASGPIAGQGAHSNGMMGRSAGYSGGMMGDHDGMTGTAGNGSSCYSCMQDYQPWVPPP